jgi:hypothetical protein
MGLPDFAGPPQRRISGFGGYDILLFLPNPSLSLVNCRFKVVHLFLLPLITNAG